MEHKLHVICGMNASTKYHKQISAYLLMKMFISERAREKKNFSQIKRKKFISFFLLIHVCRHVTTLNS